MKPHQRLDLWVQPAKIETELLIARRLNYLDEADFMLLSKDLDDVGRMISGLSRSLQRREA